HLCDYVIQVRSMGDVLQERLILLAQSYPVIAVHVRNIEPVAIAAPDFIENLVPFFGRYAIDYQAGSRDRFSAFVSLWRRIKQAETRRLSDQDFCAIL